MDEGTADDLYRRLKKTDASARQKLVSATPPALFSDYCCSLSVLLGLASSKVLQML